MAVTKRDQVILIKIQGYQNLLKDTVKELRISAPSNLSGIHPMMRRESNLIDRSDRAFEHSLESCPTEYAAVD